MAFGNALPASWAGTTVSTLLPNYNGSLSGNFRSLVTDWEVGQPAEVPSSQTVWWPEFPVSVGGSPAPTSAPALIYSLRNSSFVGVDTSVANASALAYDPLTGLLYATDPSNNSVEVVNPATGLPTGVTYPVGSDPAAVVFDPSTRDLFVANSGSANVTVINPGLLDGKAIVWPGISVRKDPVSLADDSTDGWVYVADAGASYLSRLNTTNLSEPSLQTSLFNGPADGVAYSPESGYVAVTTASSPDLTIISAKNGSVRTSTIEVGQGDRAIGVTASGSTFVVANASGTSVVNVSALYPFTVSSSSLAVGSEPTQLLTITSTGAVLVWNNGSRSISVLSAGASSVIATSPSLAPEPTMLAYDADSHALFVGDSGSPGIDVLDPFSGASIGAPIVLPGPPLALALDPSTSTLYVGLNGSILAYNTATRLLTAQNTTLAGLNGPIAFDAITQVLWVGRESQGIVVAVNPSTLVGTGGQARVAVVAADAEGIAVDSETGSIVVLNSTDSDVSEFNGSSGALLGTPVSVGTNVTSLVWDQADGFVYAAGDSLVAIQPTSMSLATSQLPLAPHSHVGGIAYEPSREAIYVATWTTSPYSGSLSVFNGSSASSSQTSLTVIPTGFEPSALASVEASENGLADSGVVLSANTESGTVSVVASPPEILSASFSPESVDQGVPTTLYVGAIGGAGESFVSYSGLPTGCLGGATLVVMCTPTDGGTFAVVVKVVDSIGESVAAVADLSVASTLSAFADVGSLPSHEVDLGVPVDMSASGSGGTLPYAYSWSFGDGTSASTASVDHQFDHAGTYVVSLTVTDPTGGVAVNETIVTVEPDPWVTVLATPGTTEGATTDVGLTVGLSATVVGGVAPGSGDWQLGNDATLPGPAIEYSWTAPGLYSVNYTYSDALGVDAEGTLNVLVHPELTGRFSVVPNTASPTVGTEFTFNATLANGTPGYTVVWSFGDDSTAEGPQVSHTYAAPGTYAINVTASDAAGASVSETFKNVVVTALPGPSTPLFGGGFGPSFVLGIVVGAVVAAVVLFVAERSRKAGPSGPPSPYVPPPPRVRPRP